MRFRIQIFKQQVGSDREWSNTWLYEADDLATAVAGGTALANGERAFHQDFVTVTRVLISDTDPSTDFFSTVTINLPGTKSSGADGAWLPLYNTYRIDINVTGGGRPSRKFYRGPVAESEQQSAFLDPVTRGALEASMNATIASANAAGGELVDPDGQTLLDAHAFAKVQMRQLHRKRKKKTP